MVSDNTERRDRPEYSLSRVRELAEWGSVDYATSAVQRDVENLAYAPEDVHRCLQTLEESQFCHAERYHDSRVWLDVYRIRYPAPTGDVDPLYLKLKLNRDCVTVLLFSFHRDR